jgi:hypothetical protein
LYLTASSGLLRTFTSLAKIIGFVLDIKLETLIDLDFADDVLKPADK